MNIRSINFSLDNFENLKIKPDFNNKIKIIYFKIYITNYFYYYYYYVLLLFEFNVNKNICIYRKWREFREPNE